MISYTPEEELTWSTSYYMKNPVFNVFYLINVIEISPGFDFMLVINSDIKNTGWLFLKVLLPLKHTKSLKCKRFENWINKLLFQSNFVNPSL